MGLPSPRAGVFLIGCLIVLAGNAVAKLRRNYVLGIRTRWTTWMCRTERGACTIWPGVPA
jgi:uncharacterized membrane protein